MRLLKLVPDNTNIGFVRLRYLAFGLTALLTLAAATLARFDIVYRTHAPGLHAHGEAPDTDDFVDPVAGSAAFAPVEQRTYHEDRVFTADEWLGMVATFSDHQRLAPDDRATLLGALRTVIEAGGGEVPARAGVLLLLARRR